MVVMSRASFTLNSIGFMIFAPSVLAMRLFVGGESDWDLAIALLTGMLIALGISLIGLILSCIAIWRASAPRWMARVGLGLGLVLIGYFMLAWLYRLT